MHASGIKHARGLCDALYRPSQTMHLTWKDVTRPGWSSESVYICGSWWLWIACDVKLLCRTIQSWYSSRWNCFPSKHDFILGQSERVIPRLHAVSSAADITTKYHLHNIRSWRQIKILRVRRKLSYVFQRWSLLFRSDWNSDIKWLKQC